jgi:hypothetical protein
MLENRTKKTIYLVAKQGCPPSEPASKGFKHNQITFFDASVLYGGIHGKWD